MKILFVALAIAFSAHSALAGTAEQEARWAWKHLPEFLLTCFYSSACPMNESQKSLIPETYRNLMQYKDSQLVFKSEKENPDLFKSDQGEIHRLIVTGLSPTDPIVVNQDRLVLLQDQLGPAQWLGLFSHEIIHHLGIKDDQKRIPDQFGAAVTTVAENFVQAWTLSEPASGIAIFILSFPPPTNLGFLKVFPNGINPIIAIRSQDTFDELPEFEKFLSSLNICGKNTFFVGQLAPVNENIGRIDASGNAKASIVLENTSYCLSEKQDSLDWGRVRIALNFSLSKTASGTHIDPGSYFLRIASEEQEGAGAWLEWINANIPAEANAGTPLTFDVTVRNLSNFDFKSCASRFTRPGWPDFASGLPYSFYGTDCQIIEKNNDIYRIKVTLPLSTDTLTGDIILSAVCLSPGLNPGGEEGCADVSPPVQTPIRINNTNAVSHRILNAEILHAKPLPLNKTRTRYYHIPHGDFFTLRVTFEGSVDVFEGFFDAHVVNAQDYVRQFNGPLYGPSARGPFVIATRIQKSSQQTVVEMDFVPPAYAGDGTDFVSQLTKFNSLTFVLGNLELQAITFGQFDFAVAFTEEIFKGKK